MARGPGGTGKRRSTAQRARDRRKIADLYLQGWLQADIAGFLGVSPSTISNDLKALQGAWLQSTLMDFDEAKARELAKVDRLEREYWEAWIHSCEDAETIRQEGNPKKDPSRVIKTSKGQAGDPRFLQGVQWCIDKRCKIIGIDAPQKVEIYDWRTEAKDKGIDTAELFEQFIQNAYVTLQESDRNTGNGSAE